MSNKRPSEETAFPNGPEFWFDKDGALWFGHECASADYRFDREYTLPGSIYEITTEPANVVQIISCGLCKIRGRIVDGEWRLIED